MTHTHIHTHTCALEKKKTPPPTHKLELVKDPMSLGPRVDLAGQGGGAGAGRAERETSATCIGLKVLRRHHDHEPDGALITEHLVGPAADGAHALHGSNAVVGNEHLMETPGDSGHVLGVTQPARVRAGA